jgi:hypothetical protein
MLIRAVMSGTPLVLSRYPLSGLKRATFFALNYSTTTTAIVDYPFNRELTAKLADLLNKGNVENVLWGNSLLDIYGIPTVVWVSPYKLKLIDKQFRKLVLPSRKHSFTEHVLYSLMRG